MSTTNAEHGGLREQKKQATRTALTMATIALASRDGWDNVRVEDIAAEAGVSPRTFNNYFASKEEAMLSFAMARTDLMLVEFGKRPAEEPLWEALRHALLVAIPGADGLDLDWVRQVHLIRRSQALQGYQLRLEAQLSRRLRETIAERTGLPLDDLFPRLAANVLLTSARTAVDHWYDVNDPDLTPADVLMEALRQVSEGLPEPPRPAPAD